MPFLSLDKQGLFKIPGARAGMILLADDGNVLAERGSFFGDEVRLDEPSFVPQAVIAIEDRRLLPALASTPSALLRAGFANLQAGRVVEGGSTITQQLAKNLFLQPDRTIERKFQEMILAFWLESKFTKDEILQLYLNRVYYGAGAVGIERAAQRPFLRSARDVNLAQAAILAAVLKAPSAYNPINHPDRATARAGLVISGMVEAGFITQSEATGRLFPQDRRGKCRATLPAQYIVDYVQRAAARPHRQVRPVDRRRDHHRPPAPDRRRALGAPPSGARGRQAQCHPGCGGDHERARWYQGDGRRPLLCQEPVQPRRQGRSASPAPAFKAFVYLTAIEQGATPD